MCSSCAAAARGELSKAASFRLGGTASPPSASRLGGTTSPPPPSFSARRRRAGAHVAAGGSANEVACAPDPADDLGKRSFLPSGFSLVSSRFSTSEDVVSHSRVKNLFPSPSVVTVVTRQESPANG